jgi:AcrR family transcriptional regulator
VSGGGAVRGRRGPVSRERVLEVQRERIVEAMARVVGERGFQAATIAEVARTAGVSRATFYDVFKDLDACFLAVLDSVMRRSTALISDAFAKSGPWQVKMLAGLMVLLDFLDSEPLAARVCLVEALAAGPAALEYRARELEVLKHLVDAMLEQAPAGRQVSTLAAEGMVASVAGILHVRLVTGEAPPFMDLLGSLADLVIAPYVDPRMVAEETRKAEQLAQSISRERAARSSRRHTDVPVPNALRSPRAYRARLCLFHVADHPGVSNRAVADNIGVSHYGQISTLLGRLERLGLLTKRAGGAGRTNAWWVTPEGEQVAEALRDMY